MSRTANEVLEDFRAEVPEEEKDYASAYMAGSMASVIAHYERELERIGQLVETARAVIKKEAD